MKVLFCATLVAIYGGTNLRFINTAKYYKSCQVMEQWRGAEMTRRAVPALASFPFYRSPPSLQS